MASRSVQAGRNLIMPSVVHFISGLPRSGSTLLCAILRQNPRFSASMTSPVISLVSALLPKMSDRSEFGVFFTNDRRRSVLRAAFHGYYAGTGSDQVIFDTNRLWTAKAALATELYPNARIVCCVREVGWIIDSIERMLRRNPLELSRIFKFQTGSSVYARVELLMNSDSGLIGAAWSAMREAWFSEYAQKLIVVNYDKLVREPLAVMQQLYKELNEPQFEHDFNNVIYDEPDYDAAMGMPGLHKVREKVEYQKREPCIPPDMFTKYADTQFWLKPEMNKRGVTIL
jgi:sulfotransferase